APRLGLGVVDLEQAADGVVLEPLPDVALVGAGAGGQLRGGGRAAVGERPVQAEPLAQVDGVELQRAHGVLEQPLGQGGGTVALLCPAGEAAHQDTSWSLESRTTSCGSKTIWRWPCRAPSAASSMSSSAAARPSWSRGWRTDDSGTA